jgi:N4-gp56 family major capsid protein
MATQTLTNPADVANRLQTYFSRKLLDPIENTLVLDQFAQTEDLPANMAAKTIRFFRRRQAGANANPLTEGVAIAAYAEVASGYVDCTLSQRGEAAKLSDILQWTDIFNWLNQNVDTLVEDAALDFDTITRNAIVTGLNNSNGNYERFSGVQNTGNSAADFTSLAGLSPAAGASFSRNAALACATQLMSHKVPRMNGGYVGVLPPQVMHDVRKDPTWILSAQYGKQETLYKHEVITLDGIRYVEGTNPFVESVYGTYNSAGSIFTTMIIGRGAYGTPKLTKTTSPMKPQIIINNKPDKSDPLNQFTTLGWKAYWGAVALITNLAVGDDPPHFVLYRSKSSFV